MAGTATAWGALVLAGERLGGDPLARRFGVERKALLPLAGRPMIAHVVAALRAAGPIERIAVSGLAESAVRALPDLAGLATCPSAESPSASVVAALDERAALPLLVTTADHPLLRAETVRRFLAGAAETGADLAVGVVDEAVVRRRFPASRRTYVRFRSHALTGANLFAFATPAARRAAEAWREVEQDRKRPWRIVGRLGVPALVRFLLRRLPLEEALERASALFEARVAMVWLEDALAAIDVDSREDLALAAELLGGASRREAGAPASLSSPERRGPRSRET